MWEQIDGETERMEVPGGWIVRSYHYHDDGHNWIKVVGAMCFVPAHERWDWKLCDLYRNEGCSHFDSLLCDYPECSMLKEYRAKLKKQSKEPPR